MTKMQKENHCILFGEQLKKRQRQNTVKRKHFIFGFIYTHAKQFIISRCISRIYSFLLLGHTHCLTLSLFHNVSPHSVTPSLPRQSRSSHSCIFRSFKKYIFFHSFVCLCGCCSKWHFSGLLRALVYLHFICEPSPPPLLLL